MNTKLRKDIDYYYDTNGLMVFTKNYHLARGFCCESACVHCPWDYKNEVHPEIPAELLGEEFRIYDDTEDENS